MKTPEELKEALENLLKDIRDFVGDDKYMFRGEPRKDRDIEGGGIDDKPLVSSNLYRQFEKAAGVENFSINIVQSRILKSAKEHIKEEDNNDEVLAGILPLGWKASQIKEKDDAILEQLQHYGGKTNQIDFTTDYLIALFFACEFEPEKDGRLIFLKNSTLNKQGTIYEPKNPQNRVIAQKSIFVRPFSGVVETDKIIPIDKELKRFIRSYLGRYHGITSESIYNDIHGFIDRNRNYGDGYTHLHLGLAYYDEGNYDKAIEHYTEALRHDSSFAIYNNLGTAYAGKGDNTSAITYYTKAINLNPNYVNAYISRSISHGEEGDDISALKDCNEAIRLNPHYARAYDNRGIFYNNKKDYGLAIADYTKAIELDSNYAAAYHNRGISYNSRSDKGDYDLALADFDESIKLNPNDPMVYANRALAKSALQDHKGAEEDFKIASWLTGQRNPSPPSSKRK